MPQPIMPNPSAIPHPPCQIEPDTKEGHYSGLTRTYQATLIVLPTRSVMQRPRKRPQ